MKRAVVLISILNTEYATKGLDAEGRNSLDYVLESVQGILGIDIFHIYGKKERGRSEYENLAEGERTWDVGEGYTVDILKLLVEKLEGYESILIQYTDSPLSDCKEQLKLLKLHEEEHAEYSFSENYPLGVCGEVVSHELLKKLLKEEEQREREQSYSRMRIEELINEDINRYDVEVLVCEYDFRVERLELIVNNRRNYKVVKSCIAGLRGEGIEVGIKSIEHMVKERPIFMRSVPSYVEIELTNRCDCECVICPRTHLLNREIKDMEKEKYLEFLEKLYSYTGEVYISFSYMGEPFLHDRIYELIEETLKKEGIKLIIETHGGKLSYEGIDKLRELDGGEGRLYILLSLDSMRKERYNELREGGIELEELEKAAYYLLERGPKGSYIQMLRMKETEDELDNYYKKWSAYKDRIILQKHNNYRGELEGRGGVDLSPLKRFGCWHLKRDMIVLSDGRVSFCKQDINGERSYGNVFEEDIEEIWRRQDKVYERDHKGELDKFCEGCDEWYTYNF